MLLIVTLLFNFTSLPAISLKTEKSEPYLSAISTINLSTITGSCLCGRITYQLTGDRIDTKLRHCTNRSKASGLTFAAKSFYYKNVRFLLFSNPLISQPFSAHQPPLTPLFTVLPPLTKSSNSPSLRPPPKSAPTTTAPPTPAQRASGASTGIAGL